MAEQAEVIIKNNLVKEGNQNLEIIRYFPTGTPINNQVAKSQTDRFPLLGLLEYVIIKVPAGIDLKLCKLEIQADTDISVEYSRTNNQWKIQILPNKLLPDVPTNVNVNVNGGQP